MQRKIKHSNSLIPLWTLLFGLAMTILISACRDEDKDNFDSFEIGGFVRLAEPFPIVLNINTLEEVSTFSIPVIFEAPDENVVSYRLQVFATLSGSVTDTVPFGSEITSFPSPMQITADNVSSALGIDVSDIAFGDTFTFLGTATNDQGVVYGPERLAFDRDTKEISGGNNTNDLFDEQGYRNAFNFGFAIPCPPETGDIAGDWIIEMIDLFGDGWDGAFVTFTIDGVGTNFTIQDGSAATHVVSVPDGASLVVSYTPGAFEEEHIYTVEKPDGTILGPFGPNPPLCIN